MTLAAATPPARAPRIHAVGLIAAIAALICVAPALAVLWFALSPTANEAELGGHLLRDGAIGTFGLMLVGGLSATAFGTLSAWLVSLCEFPGRRWFEWLLVLPMAAPSYVLSYSYSSLTWSGGAVNFPVAGFSYKLRQPSKSQVLLKRLEQRIEDGELQIRVRNIESERALKRVNLALKTLIHACLSGFAVLSGAVLLVGGYQTGAIAAFAVAGCGGLFLLRSFLDLLVREKVDRLVEK